MPCLPYSQDKKKFRVDAKTGIVHSEMNTPGVQMAYAAAVPADGERDGQARPRRLQAHAGAGGRHQRRLFRWLLQGTKFKVGRKYAVDGYVEHRENVDKIIALLPKDFKAGMESWTGQIEQHISDTNFGL